MRQHDYDLVDIANNDEIKSVFKNLKGGLTAGVDGGLITLFKNFLNFYVDKYFSL